MSAMGFGEGARRPGETIGKVCTFQLAPTILIGSTISSVCVCLLLWALPLNLCPHTHTYIDSLIYSAIEDVVDDDYVSILLLSQLCTCVCVRVSV